MTQIPAAVTLAAVALLGHDLLTAEAWLAARRDHRSSAAHHVVRRGSARNKNAAADEAADVDVFPRRRPVAAAALRATAAAAATGGTADAVRLSPTGHDLAAWERGYTTCPAEVPPTSLPLSSLPSDFPPGTYYRNGHGKFESDDGSIRAYHMFDGDGLVSAVTFDPLKKTALFRNKFVRTDGYRADAATGGMTRPGIFGTKVSGGWTKNLFRTDFKNVANTHVLYSDKGGGGGKNDGRLYALWEGGRPYVLDPYTLDTIDSTSDAVALPGSSSSGEHDFGGLLGETDAFAAHYRVDATTGNVVNFGTGLDPLRGRTTIKLYEFTPDMEPVRRRPEAGGEEGEVSFVFDGAGVVHDFAVTPNWHVFVMPPASVGYDKAVQALLGRAAFAEVIDFATDASHATVYLVPRAHHLDPGTAKEMDANHASPDKDSRIRTIEVPYHFSFHFANAFEDEDTGNVVIDSILTEEAELGFGMFTKDRPLWEQVDWTKISPTRYAQFAVDPKSGGVVSDQITGEAFKTVSTQVPEFPTVPRDLSGLRHRFSYGVGSHVDIDPAVTAANEGRGSGPAGSVMKFDTERSDMTESYAFEPYEFPGEPVFCPKIEMLGEEGGRSGDAVDVTAPGNEDRGYVVVYVVNARDMTTDLVVLDVEGKGALEKGPVARVTLPTFLPFGLHGIFVDGLTFDNV